MWSKYGVETATERYCMECLQYIDEYKIINANKY